MKKIYVLTMMVVGLMFILNSCSIEKRHYRPGYHVEWKHRVKTSPVAADESTTMVVKENKLVKQEVNSNTTTPVAEKTISAAEPQQEVLPVTENKKSITGKQAKKSLSFLVLQPEKKESIKPAVFKKHLPITETTGMSRAISDDGRLVFGIIFLLLGLSPFAVLIYVGQGSEFNLDLVIWGAGLILLLLGFIVDSLFLVYAGWIFLLAAWIYAIVVMIRRAV